MKEGIHPNYREVVFQDMSSDFKFVTRSTIQTKETITLDGKQQPARQFTGGGGSQADARDACGVHRVSDQASPAAVARRRADRKKGQVRGLPLCRETKKAAGAAFF